MRIALIEWVQGGHHEIYLKTAASALAAAGHEVWILYPEPGVIRDEIITEQPELADRLKGLQLVATSRWARATRPHIQYPAKWMTVKRALKKVEADGKQVDLAFFMYMDEFMITVVPTTWLDFAFPYPWAGIYMQPLFRFRDSDLGKRPEFFRRDHLLRSKRFKGAMPLDDAAVPWLTERFKRKFVGAPEFGNIAPPDLAAPVVQELVKFAAGRPIVGAFGALSKRKGVLNLLRAAPLLRDANCVFALAGHLVEETFTPEELTELRLAAEGLGERCWFRPEKVATDAQFSGLISVSSVCYIAYEDWVFGSGLQSIAAEFDVPAIVGNAGVMPENAKEYQTGIEIDPKSPEEAANAIRKLLQERLPAEGFARYRADHRIEVFKSDLCEFVTEI